MCSRNFPVQKCLSALAVPDVTEVITGVIRIICPLPGPRYLSQPVRDVWALRGAVRVHDVSIQCIQNKTFFYQLNRNQLLRESFGTQKATPSNKGRRSSGFQR